MGDALATTVFGLVFYILPVLGLGLVVGGPVSVVAGVIGSRRGWPESRRDRWVRRGIYAVGAGLLLWTIAYVAFMAFTEAIGS